MSSNLAITVDSVSKSYHIYEKPRDRLKQFLMPRLRVAQGGEKKKYFNEFWALRDVSLNIKRGETVGIVGRNGSGKSTLLQVICGVLNPTEGNVKSNGRISALLELGSGFNPEFTGRENVYLNAAVLGLSRLEVDARFEDIAAFADIGAFIEQPVKTYSSGMVVRLAFAVAIHVEPQILVVDEALSVGDELFQRKCFSRIESLKAAGATILFVSHSGAAVVELCDRAILLDSGNLIADGEPKSIVASYQKLLYAPAEKRSAVRDTIISMFAADEGVAGGNRIPTDRKMQTDRFEDFSHGEEIFDPDFLPQSTIEFEPRGASIGDAEILTFDSRQVNGLVRGRSYRFRFDVGFEQTASNVRFGMLLKTGTGLPIGGGLSASTFSSGIAVVSDGTNVSVDFKFECRLNPGVYFLNAGVFGSDNNGDEVVLHRKADILAFRVMPVENNCATEIIDFGFSCELKIREEVV